MILATIQDGDSNGLSFFSQSEIGDVDGDKMPEILDPWERPIEFLRWPAGLQDSELNDVANPDPFDPNQTDPRFADPVATNPFILMPLILSAGPDEQYGIVLDDTPALHYKSTAVAPFFVANDPYVKLQMPVGQQLGVRISAGYEDNIHNHQDLSE